MGAHDTFSAQARCPRCQELFWIDGQTTFFDPNYGGLFNRWFKPGVPQPLERSALALTTAWVCNDWWRVREPIDPVAVQVLVSEYELFGCDCGAGFAVILRFRQHLRTTCGIPAVSGYSRHARPVIATP